MSLLEELKTLGVHIEEGEKRLGGNIALYERMLFKFADMMQNSSVSPDFDFNDYDGVIEAAHTIKGTSGNLSITPIYEAYSEIVRLLRAGQPELAKEQIEKIIPVQAEIVNCIKKYA